MKNRRGRRVVYYDGVGKRQRAPTMAANKPQRRSHTLIDTTTDDAYPRMYAPSSNTKQIISNLTGLSHSTRLFGSHACCLLSILPAPSPLLLSTMLISKSLDVKHKSPSQYPSGHLFLSRNAQSAVGLYLLPPHTNIRTQDISPRKTPCPSSPY